MHKEEPTCLGKQRGCLSRAFPGLDRMSDVEGRPQIFSTDGVAEGSGFSGRGKKTASPGIVPFVFDAQVDTRIVFAYG